MALPLGSDLQYRGYSAHVAARGTGWVAPECSEWDSTICDFQPPGNATTATVSPGMAITAVGTATARNVAATSAATRLKRIGYVSAATAAALCGIRCATAQFTLGGPAAVGGFLFEGAIKVSDAATVAGARMIYGIMANAAALTNVEPSTLVNLIGIGHGAADTNLKLFYGGSAAQAPIDLGANFPAPSTANAYRLAVFAPRDTAEAGFLLGWKVERLGTAFAASGVIAGAQGTVAPAETTLLTLNSMRTNNATALAVGMDFGKFRLAIFN